MGSGISRLYDPITKRSRLHGLYCRPTSQVPLLRKETQNSASPSVAFLLLSPPKASSTRLSFDRGPCRNCHSSFNL